MTAKVYAKWVCLCQWIKNQSYAAHSEPDDIRSSSDHTIISNSSCMTGSPDEGSNIRVGCVFFALLISVLLESTIGMVGASLVLLGVLTPYCVFICISDNTNSKTNVKENIIFNLVLTFVLLFGALVGIFVISLVLGVVLSTYYVVIMVSSDGSITRKGNTLHANEHMIFIIFMGLALLVSVAMKMSLIVLLLIVMLMSYYGVITSLKNDIKPDFSGDMFNIIFSGFIALLGAGSGIFAVILILSSVLIVGSFELLSCRSDRESGFSISTLPPNKVYFTPNDNTTNVLSKAHLTLDEDDTTNVPSKANLTFYEDNTINVLSKAHLTLDEDNTTNVPIKAHLSIDEDNTANVASKDHFTSDEDKGQNNQLSSKEHIIFDENKTTNKMIDTHVILDEENTTDVLSKANDT